MRACVFLLLLASFISAQQDDLAERIRRLVGPSLATTAATSLQNRDYETLDQLLSVVQPSDSAGRAELQAVRGGVAFIRNRFSESIAHFERADKESRLSERDRFTYAMALIESGEQRKAKEVLVAMSAEHPQTALYVYWQGRIDYYERRYDDALQEFKQAEQLDPGSARVWNSLGLTYDMRGRQDEAEAALRKAADLNRAQAKPSPWPPHDLGYLLLRLGKFQEAEQTLDESLRYNPNLPVAHYHLGRVLDKEGKQDAAMKEYQIAVAGDPASADACYSLAMLYRKQHRESEAEAMFAEWKKRKTASEPGVPVSSDP